MHFIFQRQLVEQKQKQKRQIPGMVHASDSRPQTARAWRGSKEEAKPLMTGYSINRNNQGVVLCKLFKKYIYTLLSKKRIQM